MLWLAAKTSSGGKYKWQTGMGLPGGAAAYF